MATTAITTTMATITIATTITTTVIATITTAVTTTTQIIINHITTINYNSYNTNSYRTGGLGASYSTSSNNVQVTTIYGSIIKWPFNLKWLYFRT